MALKCERCGTELRIGMYPWCKGTPDGHGAIASRTSAFPFEAPHVRPDGKPMVIESMHHLRRVEREYGVVFSAFNNSVSNSIDPIKGDLPKYRGEDADFQYDHRKR